MLLLRKIKMENALQILLYTYWYRFIREIVKCRTTAIKMGSDMNIYTRVPVMDERRKTRGKLTVITHTKLNVKLHG